MAFPPKKGAAPAKPVPPADPNAPAPEDTTGAGPDLGDGEGTPAAAPAPGLTCPHCGAPVKHHAEFDPTAAIPGEGDGDGDEDGDTGGGDPEGGNAPALDLDDAGGVPAAAMEEPIEPAQAGDKEPKQVGDDREDDGDGDVDEPGQVQQMSERRRGSLATEVRQLREALAETQKQLARQQRGQRREMAEKLLNSAIRAGKVTRALVGTEAKPGWARSFAFRDPKGFQSWVASAPVMVEFGERGTAREQAADQAGNTAVQVDKLARVKMSEQPGITYSDATKLVLGENRALSESYDREMVGERRSGASAAGVRRL